MITTSPTVKETNRQRAITKAILQAFDTDLSKTNTTRHVYLLSITKNVTFSLIIVVISKYYLWFFLPTDVYNIKTNSQNNH